ncbi:hypothetical protein D9M73_186550 [compost metagenome]
MVITNASLGVGKVMRRPVLVVEGAPDLELVIDGHRVVDAQVFHGLGDVADIAFEGKLRRMHADHHQALIAILLGPGFHIGQRAQAVDAGVSPEIHQHDLAFQGLGIEGWRVEPLHGALQ